MDLQVPQPILPGICRGELGGEIAMDDTFPMPDDGVISGELRSLPCGDRTGVFGVFGVLGRSDDGEAAVVGVALAPSLPNAGWC
jgi:hypothetical protein